MHGSLGEVAQDIGALRRLLRGDDLPLVLHRQLSVPALQAHPPPLRHSSVGLCRAVTAGCASGTSPCCPGQPCACASGRGLYIEAHLRVQDAICGLCVLWRHSEALVEAGEEVSEHAVSVIDGCCLRESQFGYEPVLEGAGHTLNPPLGLRRANISCTPSSSIARLNWVGAPAASEGGVYLNTACRSA